MYSLSAVFLTVLVYVIIDAWLHVLYSYRYSVGDVNVPFCLQSVSKPLTYALVLDELTPKVVHSYVGHEPSGTSFNQISLDYQGTYVHTLGEQKALKHFK